MECGRCRAGLIHISIDFRQNCVHKCIQDILGTLRNRTVPWYAITSSNFGIKVSNTSECLKKRNYSITVLLFDDNSSMSIWTSSNAILHNTIWLSTNYFQHQILVSCIYICTSKDLHHQSKKNNSVANKISSSPPTLPDLGPASLAAINTTRSTYPTYSEIEEQTFEDSRKLTTV